MGLSEFSLPVYSMVNFRALPTSSTISSCFIFTELYEEASKSTSPFLNFILTSLSTVTPSFTNSARFVSSSNLIFHFPKLISEMVAFVIKGIIHKKNKTISFFMTYNILIDSHKFIHILYPMNSKRSASCAFLLRQTRLLLPDHDLQLH